MERGKFISTTPSRGASHSNNVGEKEDQRSIGLALLQRYHVLFSFRAKGTHGLCRPREHHWTFECRARQGKGWAIPLCLRVVGLRWCFDRNHGGRPHVEQELAWWHE